MFCLNPVDVLRIQYSCGVVLVFWFWRDIVFGATYVLSLQYSCAVMSVFWLWQEIVLKMRSRFYKKIYWVTLFWSDSRCVYFIRPNTLLLCIFLFVYFSCTTQIHKLKFKSEYYLRINIEIVSKCEHQQSHTLISWTMLIGFLYFRETTR